jgi:hypothetical protein
VLRDWHLHLVHNNDVPAVRNEEIVRRSFAMVAFPPFVMKDPAPIIRDGGAPSVRNEDRAPIVCDGGFPAIRNEEICYTRFLEWEGWRAVLFSGGGEYDYYFLFRRTHIAHPKKTFETIPPLFSSDGSRAPPL